MTVDKNQLKNYDWHEAAEELLARALIHQPKFLFCNEPTSGLDPSTSRMIHKLLLELEKSKEPPSF